MQNLIRKPQIDPADLGKKVLIFLNKFFISQFSVFIFLQHIMNGLVKIFKKIILFITTRLKKTDYLLKSVIQERPHESE